MGESNTVWGPKMVGYILRLLLVGSAFLNWFVTHERDFINEPILKPRRHCFISYCVCNLATILSKGSEGNENVKKVTQCFLVCLHFQNFSFLLIVISYSESECIFFYLLSSLIKGILWHDKVLFYAKTLLVLLLRDQAKTNTWSDNFFLLPIVKVACLAVLTWHKDKKEKILPVLPEPINGLIPILFPGIKREPKSRFLSDYFSFSKLCI